MSDREGKRYLGLDISSSSTGWNVVDVVSNTKKLVEYGLICPVGSMGVTQRLYFFGNELKKIIDKFQPDEISAEETILVRGPKIMRTLSRFSGVALFLAYSYQKREIKTYEPSMWKKSLGLKGSAVKPEIQLKICEAFGLLEQKKIDEYLKILKEIEEKQISVKTTLSKELKQKDKEFNSFEKTYEKNKKELKKKKKKEITEQDTKLVENQEVDLTNKKEELKNKKKECQEALRDIDKRYEKVSVDIYSDSGVNSDISDSIGVTLIMIKGENNNE